MPNEPQSRDGMPRMDKDRPSPDTGRIGAGGQASVRSNGESPDPAERNDRPMAGAAKDASKGSDSPSSQEYRGHEKNPSDAGDIGAPGPGMFDRNGPSDPDAKRNR
jgi:hypothetical protein